MIWHAKEINRLCYSFLMKIRRSGKQVCRMILWIMAMFLANKLLRFSTSKEQKTLCLWNSFSKTKTFRKWSSQTPLIALMLSFLTIMIVRRVIWCVKLALKSVTEKIWAACQPSLICSTFLKTCQSLVHPFLRHKFNWIFPSLASKTKVASQKKKSKRCFRRVARQALSVNSTYTLSLLTSFSSAK